MTRMTDERVYELGNVSPLPGQCSLCHESYGVDLDLEDTGLCNLCAQDVWPELLAELDAARRELAEARAENDDLTEQLDAFSRGLDTGTAIIAAAAGDVEVLQFRNPHQMRDDVIEAVRRATILDRAAIEDMIERGCECGNELRALLSGDER